MSSSVSGSSLRTAASVVLGGAVSGILNFLVFLYFYRELAAEHVSEYWRSIHAGQMLVEVLPWYLAVSVLVVGLTLRLARSSVAPGSRTQ